MSDNNIITIGKRQCTYIQEEKYLKVEIQTDVFLLIDPEDKEALGKHEWRYKNGQIIAVVCNKVCRLARVLLNVIAVEGMCTHVNENALDNRRNNL